MSAGIIWEIFLEEGRFGLGLKDGMDLRQRRGEHPEQRRGGRKGQNQQRVVDQAWLERGTRRRKGRGLASTEHLSCQAQCLVLSPCHLSVLSGGSDTAPCFSWRPSLFFSRHWYLASVFIRVKVTLGSGGNVLVKNGEKKSGKSGWFLHRRSQR